MVCSAGAWGWPLWCPLSLGAFVWWILKVLVCGSFWDLSAFVWAFDFALMIRAQPFICSPFMVGQIGHYLAFGLEGRAAASA